MALAPIVLSLLLSQSDPGQPGPYTVASALMTAVDLGNETLTVNLYWPMGQPLAIPAVVGHGFARNASHISGWGEHLASHGFAVAVPNFPSPLSPNHTANGQRMVALLTWLRSSPSEVGTTVANTGGVLVGHSAGGLAAIIGASMVGDLQAVLGLDPVDNINLGAMAAGSVTAPVVMLAAEASSCNAQGSAASFFGSVVSPGSWYAKVVAATHCDGENPSNNLCNLTCGAADPARRALHLKYGTAHLLAATSCTQLDHLPGGAVLLGHVMSGAITDVQGTGPSCGPTNDAGVPNDAGAVPDSGIDGGAPDSGAPGDTGGIADASIDQDAGLSGDAAGTEDAGLPTDAGATFDSGSNDSGASGNDAQVQDVQATDSGAFTDTAESECGCRTSPGASMDGSGLWALAGLWVLRRAARPRAGRQ